MQDNTFPCEGMSEHGDEAPQARDRVAFISKSSTILDAMANPTRLAILTQLVKAETNVTDLSQIVGLGQSALSQHIPAIRWQ